MNKPRPSALSLNKAVRVAPPVAPGGGFFSFHSFRVKKNQNRSDSAAEQSNRRRVASGDCDNSSSSTWASAVVSPVDDDARKEFTLDLGKNGTVSTFKTFKADSAPCSPCTGNDYRFLKGTKISPVDGSYQSFQNSNYLNYPDENKERCAGFGNTEAPLEMHKGYERKLGPNKSLSEIAELPTTKPPAGILRHQTLRSNSEPFGHGYVGGGSGAGTDLNVGPPVNSNNHVGFSTVFATNHHHIVLEDQGIDMSQSPGHESPSSTVSSNTVSVSGGSGVSSSAGSAGTGTSHNSRHSAASFDSGRASSTLYQQQGVRYSGLSSESSSTGSCRHSYHSSSSSLGSIPPEEICNFDVSSMIAQGLPDSEILNAWLTGVHFECYYQNFIQAGYDMQTIVKMTPEDLNAIGITKPNHRKRLKSEISQLIIPDGLPEYIPSTIEEWLRVLRLDDYTEKLKAQGYTNVRQVTNITWEDLEDIGILKLGHQKKFLLAIKRIEDILSGKRVHSNMTMVGGLGGGGRPPNPYHPSQMDCYAAVQPPLHPHHHHRLLQSSQQMPYSQHNLTNQGPPPQLQSSSGGVARPYINNSFQKGFVVPHQQSVPPYGNNSGPSSTWRQNSLGGVKEDHSAYLGGENIYGGINNGSSDKPQHLQLLTHQPQIHPEKLSTTTNGLNQPEYHPEVIAIHVKSDRRPSAIASDHCGEPIYGTSSFQAPPHQPNQSSRNGPPLHGKWLDDGETTPTNEVDPRNPNSVYSVESSSTFGTSTLPRMVKNKPFGNKQFGTTGTGGGGPGDLNNKPESHHIGLDVAYQQQQQCLSSSTYQQYQATSTSSSMDGYKSLPKNLGRVHHHQHPHHPNSSFGVPRNGTGAGGMPMSTRQPPPPPRRSSSTTQESSKHETFSTFHPSSGSNPRPNESSMFSLKNENDLPDPPPPEDLAMFNESSSSEATSNSSGPVISQNNLKTTSSTSLTSNNANSNAAPGVPTLPSSSSSTNPPSDYQLQHHHNNHAYPNNSSTNSVNNIRIHPASSNSSTASSSSNRLRDPSPILNDADNSNVTFPTVGVRRNGSDASFKSSSSTESESLPFANDNAGTIKQQKPGNRGPHGGTALENIYGVAGASSNTGGSGEHIEAGDVLSDIGNMLADLTDELDAILQQEMDSLK